MQARVSSILPLTSPQESHQQAIPLSAYRQEAVHMQAGQQRDQQSESQY